MDYPFTIGVLHVSVVPIGAPGPVLVGLGQEEVQVEQALVLELAPVQE
ncbi:unnamed protein product [marine sediment metagenome]|uniref:Uncharacterized protein n=1 Tax=marine sediment metagenome TaxID=412755 RepID=X1PN37_9ZZZZ